jgi:diguanylate cyclase (GGDEF)-like protein
MRADGESRQNHAKGQLERVGKDIIVLAVSFGALILFVGNGSTVLPQAIRYLQGIGLPPDRLLSNAMLLNIALIVFGWRRYRDLSDQVVERSAAEERARQLAETDPLTGCLNRRAMAPATEHLREQSARHGEQVALLVLDLDNFKRLNDTNGHAAGDAVLSESARRMRAVLPTGALLARLGGDEFACAVPFDPARPEFVDRIASQLIESLCAPIVSSGLTLEGISISLGISRSDIPAGKSLSAQDLLHMADIAMYHAKKGGKNRYYWFEPQMESELRFRSELENGIRRGVGNGEFVPFYEPQVCLQTGRITGFEMLARWQSPEMGLVGPDLFGVIADLSESVIRQALQDAKEWHPELGLSVNISPVQMRDPWFAQKLLKLLVEANFPPSRLEIEITESCLHENLGVVRSLITSLKNQGVAISLDDFGTGYSSLAQLSSLPFDRIKIDRSFVSSINASKDASTIVKSITSLGEGMNLPITAEGIENREVLDQLRTMGSTVAPSMRRASPRCSPKRAC